MLERTHSLKVVGSNPTRATRYEGQITESPGLCRSKALLLTDLLTDLFEIDVIHPGEFLLDLLDLAPAVVLEERTRQAAANRGDPKTLSTLLGVLDRSGVSSSFEAAAATGLPGVLPSRSVRPARHEIAG